VMRRGANLMRRTELFVVEGKDVNYDRRSTGALWMDAHRMMTT